MDPTYTPFNPAVAGDLPDVTFDHLMGLPWLAVTPVRREYFMSDTPRTYAYKTYDGPRQYQSAAYTRPVDAIRQALNLKLGAAFNVCFLSRYDTMKNHLGWHADDSPETDRGHPIAVVSFGAVREIWWKPKLHKGPVPAEWRQELGHGSLFVMPAGFQDEYLHRIPKGDRERGVRISLTFRRYVGV